MMGIYQNVASAVIARGFELNAERNEPGKEVKNDSSDWPLVIMPITLFAFATTWATVGLSPSLSTVTNII